MLYFLDTEFSDRGPNFPIQLISIGVVNELGKEFYRVVRDCDFDTDGCNDFVKQNVLPKIFHETRTDLSAIVNELLEFVKDDKNPFFVGYHCSTDWVIIKQLFHAQGGIPRNWTKYCFDIVQLNQSLGWPKMPKKPKADKRHNSMEDARWIKKSYEFLMTIKDAVKSS